MLKEPLCSSSRHVESETKQKTPKLGLPSPEVSFKNFQNIVIINLFFVSQPLILNFVDLSLKPSGVALCSPTDPRFDLRAGQD